MPSDRQLPYVVRHIEIREETSAALFIATKEGVSHWIPKTDIFEIVRSPNFFDSKVTVSLFIARQEGLV